MQYTCTVTLVTCTLFCWLIVVFNLGVLLARGIGQAGNDQLPLESVYPFRCSCVASNHCSLLWHVYNSSLLLPVRACLCICSPGCVFEQFDQVASMLEGRYVFSPSFFVDGYYFRLQVTLTVTLPVM